MTTGTNKKDGLTNKIKKWLSKQGYPLEMEAARIFRDQGYQVQQSEYFFDTQGEKHREVDLICDKVISNHKTSTSFGITFIVECKSSLDKPWLLLTSPDSQATAQIDCPSKRTIIKHKKNNHLLTNIDRIKDLADGGFLKGPSRTATGLVTAFKDNKDYDLAYGAVVSIAKAARIKTSPFNISSIIYKHTLVLMFPMVLLDGILFESYLNAKNDLEIKPLKWGRLLLKNPEAGAELNVIDVVTKANLINYLTSVDADFNHLLDIGQKTPDLLNIENITMREAVNQITQDINKKKQLE